MKEFIQLKMLLRKRVSPVFKCVKKACLLADFHFKK